RGRPADAGRGWRPLRRGSAVLLLDRRRRAGVRRAAPGTATGGVTAGALRGRAPRGAARRFRVPGGADGGTSHTIAGPGRSRRRRVSCASASAGRVPGGYAGRARGGELDSGRR